MKNELSEDVSERISESILAGRKIDAIKAYREATGEGLAEAKRAIEEITASLAQDHPELAAKPAAGCASVIVFSTVLAYGLFEFSRFIA